MAFDQSLALCERTAFLDGLRNVVDAVDQLPVTSVLAFRLRERECVVRLRASSRPTGAPTSRRTRFREAPSCLPATQARWGLHAGEQASFLDRACPTSTLVCTDWREVLGAQVEPSFIGYAAASA